ncbi:hypothetical protein [Pseudomonas citronellolis]|uniref:hypothetical protein n=1 Tax=Pseudomonas citronellolis TaxID=53408 RepID=UPI0020A22370|nr:hypothetical protein [Pseudomonas citronellolis]MCP1606032.1 hypothetical protein [Pseudomonas citronellolis]MCP1656558.1 hypothetical protein [Pseudomonas citronellolis]MCP1723587.1 hypothetical protein [Pseudomonas citronellolis]
MTPDLKRLMMLLVAAGFDRYRVEDLIYNIRETSIKRMLSELDRLEKGLGTESSSGGEYHPKRSYSDTKDYSDVVAKVVDLLINESNLPINKAFLSLERTLESTFPGRFIPEPKPKAGFSAWVKALNKEFSESELLHVASKIRNNVIHGGVGGSDWALKE